MFFKFDTNMRLLLTDEVIRICWQKVTDDLTDRMSVIAGEFGDWAWSTCRGTARFWGFPRLPPTWTVREDPSSMEEDNGNDVKFTHCMDVYNI